MITHHQPLPAWAIMWTIATLLFAAGKLPAARLLWQHTHDPKQIAAFTFAWVGMNPHEWRAQRHWRLPQLLLSASQGLLVTLLGALLIWGIARHLPHPLAAGWCGMIGLIFLLHFGLFRVLADFWRWRGHAVRHLMNQPTAARTLADFWGNRWNRAFRDLAHPLLLLPLHRRFGPTSALLSCFAISGLVHELVISLPAGAGYGLPFLYFILQAIGQIIERQFRLRSWLFTHAFTLLPIPLLFHEAFITRVMLPFFQTIGALP